MANAERQTQREKLSSIRKSRTDVFHHSPDSETDCSIKNMEEAMHLTTVEDGGSSFSSEIFQMSDKAPLVNLQDICSAASIDNSDFSVHNSSTKRSIQSNTSSIQNQKQALIVQSSSEFVINQLDPFASPTIKSPSGDDMCSLSSQQTVINRPTSDKQQYFQVSKGLEDRMGKETDSARSEKIAEMTFDNDPNEASFLDVAVLRCLLIKNWQEEGIFWAVKYILNRLTEMRHRNVSDTDTFRSRANSLPIGTAPRGSRIDVDYLTWADLQDKTDTIGKKLLSMGQKVANTNMISNDESIRLKVAFDGASKSSSKQNALKEDQLRRISINTLPATKKISPGMVSYQPRRYFPRSRSEPARLQGMEVMGIESNASAFSIVNVNSGAKETQSFMPEAIGSSTFIDKNGHLCLSVVLKTLGSLIEHCSVVRISEVVLNCVDTLLNMPNIDQQLFFVGIVKLLLRIYLHLGCANGCNEGMRTPQADFLRIKVKNLLLQMHKSNTNLLTEILKQHVMETQCHQLLDSIHAMTMFCQVEAERERESQRQLRASVKSRRRSSVTTSTDGRQPSYRNHFNETHAGIEGTMVGILLTPLISKLMKRKDDFSLPENMGLYNDVRMFIAYVQEKHGNPLRRTALSALAARTCATLADQLEVAAKTSNGDTRSLNESASGRLAAEGSVGSSTITSLAIGGAQRDNASLRRGLFVNKGKDRLLLEGNNVTPCLNVEEEKRDSDGESTGPSTPRQLPGSSIDESSNIGKIWRRGGKLQFALNLLKSVKNDNSEEDGWEESSGNPDESSADNLSSGVEGSKGRISFRAGQRLNSFSYKPCLSADNNSANDLQEKCCESQQESVPPFLPPRQLVIIRDIREGASRFTFLLETCRPGQMPDAPLVAAMMELKAPVLSRAVLLLECAHFIYRCNRGDWPEWTRVGNMQTRSAIIGAGSATAPPSSSFASRSGSRKTFLLQRAAGRHFYGWAVQIAGRLQKMLEEEQKHQKANEDKRKLRILDDLEDFLDDGTVNDPDGEGCPVALQLMACMLLFQISSFLRETFQLLPRSKVSHKNTSSTTGWEKLMSHRRWSILSNTFNQQTGSIHSINDLHPGMQPERRVSYSTADEESPRGSHDINADEQLLPLNDKKESHNLEASSHLLWTLRRFASRTRLFSQEQPTEEDLEQKKSIVVMQRPQGEAITKTSTTKSPPTSLQNVDAAVRRLAQGRQRLLKRGSPSTPQSILESTTRKRESLRIRKPSRSPLNGPPIEAEESNESAPLMLETRSSFVQRRRKTASFKSRLSRKVVQSMRIKNVGQAGEMGIDRPSVSSASATSSPDANLIARGASTRATLRDTLQPHTGGAKYSPSGYYVETTGTLVQPPINLSSSTCVTADQHFSPERRVMPPPLTIEDEEEEMIKNMPWIKVLIAVTNRFEVKKCTHERCCTKWCFERVYRQCRKMTKALQVVYDDNQDAIPALEKRPDHRKHLLESWQSHQENNKQQKRASNPRRESATVRQSGVDRVPLALRGLLIEKLNEIEESKAAKKESSQSVEPVDSAELSQKDSPILVFLKTQLLNIAHSPLSGLLKSTLIMSNDHYKQMVAVCWELLSHNDAHIVSSAASMFICCSVKTSEDCINIIKTDMSSQDASVRTQAVRRFFTLWRNKFHVWLKMEDNAQLLFKVPPPGIDFTLPSHLLESANFQWKQKQEMVKRAVREAEEKQSELRQRFPLLATAIVQQAAYEPALFYHQTNTQQQQQQMQNSDGNGEEEIQHTSSQQRQAVHQMPVAQPLFPSAILSVVPSIIEMFDDVQIDKNGASVGDVCRKIAWNCIVEDSGLFLRNFLEKFTTKARQEHLISLLRKLILTFRPLPSQMAYCLFNYLFGFIMFYVRTPCEGSDKSLSMALSLTWLIAPQVHGLYFKDLKQTLKKEQCDQAIMITANVPSAKKIIIHGPNSEQQILTDSLEFFNVPEEEVDQYFLMDSKTGILHNPSAYVRDFYFFHRSFYPQLTLLKMDPVVAQMKIRADAFQQKFQETGKVLLTHNALKYSPDSVIPQRIFFLHDEFTHLPSFPRRSVESCFGMYEGAMGTELQAMDSMHKFVWTVLISDMFEKMEDAFMFGDLHLFINVINGIMIIHCEDVLILRRCMATYISLAIHFNTLFASQGFFLIMPTILRCYSQRQTNSLFTQVVEFVCKQFYILHRKPFLLQMFGSVADMCDQNNNDLEINAMQVKAKYLFHLLLAMESMNELVDQIDILPLVSHPKPLKALDLCYRDDPNFFSILPDAVASCVTVCAFAPETKRSHQMLLIMQAIIPHFLKHLEEESTKLMNSPFALKHELTAYNTICVEMKALINSCDALSRGPTRTFDINPSSKEKKITSAGWDAADNSELQKEIFRGPRDSLLTLCAMFNSKAGIRLKELAKLAANDHSLRIPELLDHKCHAKLSEIAVSLLKIAPYDLNTMGCSVDWSVEANRSVLNVILRRLDKTISKIAKKQSIRRRANWASISSWLGGLYNTLTLYPYIAHLHPLKTICQMCLRLTIGDHSAGEENSSQTMGQTPPTILNGSTPPPIFCNTVLKLTAFLMQALGQFAFSLEFVCSSDGLGPLADRIEAILCHILVPLFLRAATPGKEAPQFHSKDIAFCLNLMHNSISSPLPKQSLAPMASTAFSTSLMRDSATRGSVSITDRGGHIATVSTTQRIVRDSIIQSILLALKVMILSFQKQMTPHWAKIARIVKDLVAKRAGGSALFSFIEFLVNVNLPISLIILPVVHNKLNQRPITEQEAHWQTEFRDLLSGNTDASANGCSSSESISGCYALLSKLSLELHQLKEDFSCRMMEAPRSHTPTATAGAELHSDSGSVSGTHFSYNRHENSNRRLSSTALAKIRSVTGTSSKLGSASTPQGTPAEIGHNIQDTTIHEGQEDDPCSISNEACHKSASLQGCARRLASLGVEDGAHSLEMREMLHRRTKSLNKRILRTSMVEQPAIITPLETAQVKTDLCGPVASPPSILSANKLSSMDQAGDRPRVVSFSTPKRDNYQTNEAINEVDSDEEYCITSKQHNV
uniref:Uncharacterized protein n=1 Tax=Ditylenchus dipsaci TaxID=166011 RepID=A0A915D4K6_9BILA